VDQEKKPRREIVKYIFTWPQILFQSIGECIEEGELKVAHGKSLNKGHPLEMPVTNRGKRNEEKRKTHQRIGR